MGIFAARNGGKDANWIIFAPLVRILMKNLSPEVGGCTYRPLPYLLPWDDGGNRAP